MSDLYFGSFCVIEDNAGGLYLFVRDEKGEVAFGFYQDPVNADACAVDVKALLEGSNPADWDNPLEDPAAEREKFEQYSGGWKVVVTCDAGERPVYDYSRMGRSAQKAFLPPVDEAIVKGALSNWVSGMKDGVALLDKHGQLICCGLSQNEFLPDAHEILRIEANIEIPDTEMYTTDEELAKFRSSGSTWREFLGDAEFFDRLANMIMAHLPR